jgi:Glycosyl hydrolase catalytic core
MKIHLIKNLALLLSVFLLPLETIAEPEQDPIRGRFLDSFLPEGNLHPKILGLNSFANEAQFGSISAQMRETSTILGVRNLRILLAWNDQIQATPKSPIFWSFYDEIVRNIPRRSNALVILTGLPSWMRDPVHWESNDPRKTFVQRWVKPVIERYKSERRISGFQIWNEPNDSTNLDNKTLDIATSPSNYVSMLGEASQYIRSRTRRKLVVGAATTSINQNFPEAFLYNEDLKKAGIEHNADVYAIHYYGTNIERLYFSGGISSFIRSLSLPIWITESGERGLTQQKSYARTMWPFLQEMFPGIRRFYFYKFTDAENSASESFGLKSTAGNSDLYYYLKDRAAARRLHRHPG